MSNAVEFPLENADLEVSTNSTISLESQGSYRCVGLISVPSSKWYSLKTEGEKKDYLSRIFERQKLKEKSLSKKLKTPLYRRLYRTCWPIELNKVSKIKKKPKEKKKRKPQSKCLKPRNYFTPTMNLQLNFPINDSEVDVSEEAFDDVMKNFNPNHFLHEPVTPQILMDVLQDPELLKGGATVDIIIAKLRALKLDLNPTLELLKEEVLEMLRCAIKMGMITERNGYFTVVDKFRSSDLNSQKNFPKKKMCSCRCKNPS